MKSLKNGSLVLAFVALASISLAKNKTSVPPPEPLPIERFAPLRQEMSASLKTIWNKNWAILGWKKQLSADRSSGTRAEVVFDKRTLTTVKAEKAQAHKKFSGQFKEFDEAYDGLLEAHKFALKQSQSDLRHAQAEVKKSERGKDSGGYSAEGGTSNKIAELQRESYENALAVEEVKADMKRDKHSVKREAVKRNNY